MGMGPGLDVYLAQKLSAQPSSERCSIFLLLLEMCHAVTLSVRTAGVSRSRMYRHTSAGRTSADGMGCTSTGQWHTCPQRGWLQALLWLTERSISDSSLDRPNND